MTLRHHISFLLSLFLVFAIGCLAFSQEVNVYTYRQRQLLQPIFDQFTAKYGIKVNVLYSKDGLEERIKAESTNSPADLLIATGVFHLARAAQMGLFQTLPSFVTDLVPTNLRHKNGLWTALTYRARVIYASTDRVPQQNLTYESLADSKWKNKICIRSGHHSYNVALVSGMIAHHSIEYTQRWLRDLKNNLAMTPSGNDRSQMQQIFNQRCDIAIGNTYYYGLVYHNDREPEQKEWAKAVRIIFPSYVNGGTHIDISGIGMLRHAPNKENAIKLVQFMLSENIQTIYAESNFEYPARIGSNPSDFMGALGAPQAAGLDLNIIAENYPEASEIINYVGFDDGPELHSNSNTP